MKKAQIILPDSENQLREHKLGVFLAGTIEMGKSIDWQSDLSEVLSEYPITIFNPRRTDWDSSWEQSIKNPQFNYQVNWELDKLNQSDIIFMNLLPESLSPISLLELGLHANDKLIVCCPQGFWRKGNVEIVCDRFDIPLYETYDEALESLIYIIDKRTKGD
jgi:hypothetical protein